MIVHTIGWEDVVRECQRIGVTARIEFIGSGDVIRVPLSEDGLRYAWFGSDSDRPDPDPMNLTDIGDTLVLGGCAYIGGVICDRCAEIGRTDWSEECGDERYVCMVDQTTDPHDPAAIAATIRAMVTAVMAVPEEDYEWT